MKYSLESYLTSALGAVVHRPLVSVLVHDAVMDADAVVDADAILYQLVLVCLWRGVKQRQVFSVSIVCS